MLWEHYSTEASKAHPDLQAASAAWTSWITAYLPDEAQRRSIPKPRWLA
jgi:hypothetical protein